MEKSNWANELVDWLLKKCKEHSGPVTILKELNLFLKSTHKEDKKTFLRQEVQFQKITHKKDSIGRPKLRIKICVKENNWFRKCKYYAFSLQQQYC